MEPCFLLQYSKGLVGTMSNLVVSEQSKLEELGKLVTIDLINTFKDMSKYMQNSVFSIPAPLSWNQNKTKRYSKFCFGKPEILVRYDILKMFYFFKYKEVF